MAGTVGSLKTLVEGAGLGIYVVRDRLPQRYNLPALVISDMVSTVDKHHGDFGDPDADIGIEEMVTADLYQPWRNRAGKSGENIDLPDALYRLLHGAKLVTHNKRVYGVRVWSVVRLTEVDEPDNTRFVEQADKANIVHHAFTLLIDRSL